MLTYSRKVVWSTDDRCFIATVPEFEGVSAYGSTPSDALSELEVALDLAIETYEEEGWELPEPARLHEYSGQLRLRLPKWLHASLAHEAERNGVSLNQLLVAMLAREQGAQDAQFRAARRLEAALAELMEAAGEDRWRYAQEGSQETHHDTLTPQNPVLRGIGVVSPISE